MKKIYLLATGLFLSSLGNSVQARAFVRVKSIGASPRGQFVAIEEFGYKKNRELPFSRIRVMNVWKNKYIGDPIDVIGTQEGSELRKVREQAKKRAAEQFKKFNISA